MGTCIPVGNIIAKARGALFVLITRNTRATVMTNATICAASRVGSNDKEKGRKQ
jgi:hypothetical protein